MRTLTLTILCLTLAAGARAADKGEVVDLGGLKSAAPASWKKEELTEQQRAFRVAQFRIPKEAGDPADAEVVVFFFGAGGGGGVDANLKRWQGQFKPPAGENAKTEKTKVGDVPVTVFDISGTYLFKAQPFNPDAKAVEKPDYRMVNAIFESKSGPYFLRLLGPAKTVEKHKAEFDEWLKNFK